jgi:hypothetical protein
LITSYSRDLSATLDLELKNTKNNDMQWKVNHKRHKETQNLFLKFS